MKKEEAHTNRVIRTVGKAVNRYGMIGAGDSVAVALSGGKDSYVLLETLALRKRHLPIDYNLHAVHIKIASIPYETDREYLESFCQGLGVPFHNREIDISLGREEKVQPCFLCSWHRRKELFRFCDEYRCGRLALGHHRDDIIETFLLNMLYQGSLSAMPPRLPLFEGRLDIIRPLALLPEKDLVEYARIRQFPAQKKECPYGNDSRRDSVRKLIVEMETMNKKAREVMFRAMSNVRGDYLP